MRIAKVVIVQWPKDSFITKLPTTEDSWCRIEVYEQSIESITG